MTRRMQRPDGWVVLVGTRVVAVVADSRAAARMADDLDGTTAPWFADTPVAVPVIEGVTAA